MRHATPQDVKPIMSLIKKLRTLPLKEKKIGTFYYKTTAFIHFHEDNGDLYADLKKGKDWERIKVTNQDKLFQHTKKNLKLLQE